MGDRCYMQLTCKRKDKAVFEELGFIHGTNLDDADNPDRVEMVDYEANYAHADDLPKELVYFGTHAAGDTYGAEDFACDGETYLEQLTSSDGGFVVAFDDEGNPNPADLAEIKTFVTHWNKVKSILAPVAERNASPQKPKAARIVRLKCELDQANYDQTIREVLVEFEDENNWYGKPVANPVCLTLQWPKFAWKEVQTKKGPGKRLNARLAQAPTFQPSGGKIDAKKP